MWIRLNVSCLLLQIIKLLQKGNRERTQEPTAANKTSSRSHALLIINVRQTAKSRSAATSAAAVKFGKLYMIDLAGSERAAQTQNRVSQFLFWTQVTNLRGIKYQFHLNYYD